MSLDMEFGLESEPTQKKYTRVKYEKIEQGTSYYRVLPSFNPENKSFSRTWVVHWLTGPTGKFQTICPYYTERYCPICENHFKVKGELKKSEANGDTQKVKELKESEESLRPAKSVYLNALNASNELVVLRISKTVNDLVNEKIEEAKSGKNFHPAHPKTGAWIKFTRNGNGMAAVKVDFKKISKMVDGEEMETMDRTPVSDELIEKVKREYINIHDPAKLNIKTFTSRDLAGFLKGEPLVQSGQSQGRPPVVSGTSVTQKAPPISQSVGQVGQVKTTNAAQEIERLSMFADLDS